MNLDLSGKTALVTGSTAGIGRKCAEFLAKMGATVYVNGRKTDTVLPAIEEMKATVPSGKFGAAPGDVSTREGAEAVFKVLPQLDILVNNTGIFEPKPFFEIPDEDWTRFFQVNIMSGVRMARAYLKGMLERNWGRVIFVSSESGVQPAPEMVHYSMTKTGQISISRALSELTAGTNVTVNTVLPGPTNTKGVGEYMKKYAAQEGVPIAEFEKKFMMEQRPSSLIQRLLTEEEVANMIAYVCSPAASGTNGAALRVEGGLLRCVP